MTRCLSAAKASLLSPQPLTSGFKTSNPIRFDGNSELVAELVTVNGFKAVYAIKDGAEGPRGWVNSGLPWIPPSKALSLDFGNLADAFSGAVGVWASGFSAAFLKKHSA